MIIQLSKKAAQLARRSRLRLSSQLLMTLATAVGSSMLLAMPAVAQSTSTTTPGVIVDPSTADVVLDPGDPLMLPVTVTVPVKPTQLDLFLLEDLSGSFRDDLNTVRGLVPDLVSSISGKVTDTRFGIGSYIDKPVRPFGGSSAYPYRTELAFTTDESLVQTTVNGLVATGGADGPESQLEALLQTAVRGDTSEIGFRDSAFKVAVLSTDAAFHKAGDFSRAVPNDGDADLEGTPPGSVEDYPSVAQVKTALMDANIVPIFAVTSNVKRLYEDLVTDLGIGSVVTLERDSSNLVDAIVAGLDDVFSDISLVPVGDDFGFVKSITPPGFTGVASGDAVEFKVTLAADGSESADDFRLVAPGFGETSVSVRLADAGGGPMTSVPEPGSILALLALGGLGIAKLKNQKAHLSA